MGQYWLYEYQNGHAPIRSNGKRFWGYPESTQPKVGYVVHITAGVEDVDMRSGDASAEQTARFASTTSRMVSWHTASDSDSHFYLLPLNAVAFHVRGYNSSTCGHEISKSDVTWGDENADWVEATLRHAAAIVGPACDELGIPLRHISKATLDAAIRAGKPNLGGLIGHSALDPDRRRDPGADFPWSRFLRYCAEAVAFKHYVTTSEEDEYMFISHTGTNAVYLVTGGVRVLMRKPLDADQVDPAWRKKVRVLAADHPLFRLPLA